VPFLGDTGARLGRLRNWKFQRNLLAFPP